MAAVLTTNTSKVWCTNSGSVSTVSTVPLQVKGNSVLVGASVQGQAIKGCTLQNDPQKGIVQCIVVLTVQSGFATKLRVNNLPVLLETVQGLTNGMVGPVQQQLANITAGQDKLKAI